MRREIDDTDELPKPVWCRFKRGQHTTVVIYPLKVLKYFFQIKRMVLLKTLKQSGVEVISLYLPQLRDHLTLPKSTIGDVKRLVKEMSGLINAACRFLKVTSSPSDRAVDLKNSHVCKSVLQIPHKSVPSPQLLQFDAGIIIRLVYQNMVLRLILSFSF